MVLEHQDAAIAPKNTHLVRRLTYRPILFKTSTLASLCSWHKIRGTMWPGYPPGFCAWHGLLMFSSQDTWLLT